MDQHDRTEPWRNPDPGKLTLTYSPFPGVPLGAHKHTGGRVGDQRGTLRGEGLW